MMRYHLWVLILLLIPLVSADTDTFELGQLTIDYPENAVPNQEVTITYTFELADMTIDQFTIGDLDQDPILNAECKGQKVCTGEYNFIMTQNPITLSFLGFIEGETSGQITFIDTESEFVFQFGDGSTPFVNKRFTIIPSEPQVEVVETTPYLNDEIVDRVNELGIREITKEQYLEEIELGKNLKVTKNVEFVRKEIESGADIISSWTITIEPKEGVKKAENVYIFEDVPKEGAYTDDEIINSNPKFTVLRRDPLIMWHFEEVDEPITITYETDNVGITGAATAITAQKVSKGNIWQIIIPILIIPIIGFLLIYFSKFKKN